MRARCNAPRLANFRGRYRVGLSVEVLIVMGSHVVTIERAPELSRAAHETVDATGPADNVRFVVGTARGATFPQRHVTPSKSRIAGQPRARVRVGIEANGLNALGGVPIALRAYV